ncbi:hypothetical protein [Paenibacillus silviterrae]|uniref:hypothetical protein n=1 Tax=Paenibacillus silviterrae TaxID=3242194 RepID=UPI0025430BD4|nr:hypothetical protein [Paenibacillus chinjuensis]
MKTSQGNHTSGVTNATIIHDTMDIRIGYPAFLYTGSDYPVLRIEAEEATEVHIRLIHTQSAATIFKEAAYPLEASVEASIHFPGKAVLTGLYQIVVEPGDTSASIPLHTFYFSVQDLSVKGSSKAAYIDNGRMVYVPDYLGNRLPDYSGCGYMGGGVSLPHAPVRITLEAIPGDNTKPIQDAIDLVSKYIPDEQGFRGTVLLSKGVYEIAGTLEIRASGVVLRGEGQGELDRLWYEPEQDYDPDRVIDGLQGKEATVLLATGSERRRILKIEGDSSGIRIPSTGHSTILDPYVPVGANTFHIENPEWFAVGDSIIVQRSGNAAWIEEIGMNRIPPRTDGGSITQWSPFELEFEHVITALEGNQITIDSSLVNAIETRWGGGRVYKFQDPGRIVQSGVEHLRAIAYWRPNADGVDDTRHADAFVSLDAMKNGWVRNVTLEHFTSTNGAILTGRGSKWITIQDCSSLIASKSFYHGKGYDPSGRTFYETNIYVGRYGFYLQGQSALVQRCLALNNRHGFTLGSRVTGPNVFLDCVGVNPLTWSEPHHRWSVGGLYDNVKDKISLMNRLNMGSGHGWAGANYAAWNTEGVLVAHQPPTAQNWAIGHVGSKDPGGHRGPDGYWDSYGSHVEPRSLVLQQLRDRLRHEAFIT